MTVHGNIERAIAMAEASKGSYLLFATESEDDQASQVFSDMAADMERHVKILESRKEYLEQHNNLIEQGGENGGQGQKKNGGEKKKQKKQQDQEESQG